jgi:hypothetical protein
MNFCTVRKYIMIPFVNGNHTIVAGRSAAQVAKPARLLSALRSRAGLATCAAALARPIN